MITSTVDNVFNITFMCYLYSGDAVILCSIIYVMT